MELARIAVKEGPQFVVLTGGEPAIHDWTDFSFLCSFQGSIPVHIETSGAFPLKGTFDWVTLSPKRWKEPIAETVKHANEFKFIIETPSDIKFYKEMIEDRLDSCLENLSPVVWLHPEWSHAEDSEVLNAISEAVKGSSVMRAGWQMHKLYKVDSLDPRSAPLVPLGGDASKGY